MNIIFVMSPSTSNKSGVNILSPTIVYKLLTNFITLDFSDYYNTCLSIKFKLSGTVEDLNVIVCQFYYGIHAQVYMHMQHFCTVFSKQILIVIAPYTLLITVECIYLEPITAYSPGSLAFSFT